MGLTCPWPFSPLPHSVSLAQGRIEDIQLHFLPYILRASYAVLVMYFGYSIYMYRYMVRCAGVWRVPGLCWTGTLLLHDLLWGHKHNDTPGPASTLSLYSGNTQLGGSSWDVLSVSCSKNLHGSSFMPWLVLGLALILGLKSTQGRPRTCVLQDGKTVLSASRTETRASRR